VLVVIGMPLALCRARPASFGAGLHDGSGQVRVELRLPAQDAPRRSADLTAVQTEPDAADQGLDVALAEASVSTGAATLSAIEARVDALDQCTDLHGDLSRMGLQHLPRVGHRLSFR